MKFLKKFALGTALAVSMGTAQSQEVLNNWVFNPNGGGYEAGLDVREYLDVNGNAFIVLNPADEGPSFTFREYAVFNLVQADSKGVLFPVAYEGGNISAIFEGYGTGTLGGEFTFSGGTIRMFQNPVDGQYSGTEGIYGADQGNLIATFNVLRGGGEVDASGNPVGNGQVNVFAEAAAGDLAEGFFFRENGDDLSMEDILAFAFTNANAIAQPDATLVDEVACQFANFGGPGCNGAAYANSPGQYFFIGGSGQFKLNETEGEVPEPGSLALFGIAMLGAGFAARKRNTRA